MSYKSKFRQSAVEVKLKGIIHEKFLDLMKKIILSF